MQAEPDVLNALIAAATGFPDQPLRTDPRAAQILDRWPGFLRELSRVTHADGAWLRVAAQGRTVQVWSVGRSFDLPVPDAAQMRMNRIYSQTDLPGPVARDLPIRALRWNISPDEDALLILHREDRDFRAVDGVQLANLTPYLGQAMASWRRLCAARAQAELDRMIARDLGCGWLLFHPAGNLADMSPHLPDLIAATPGLRLRAGGWLDIADPALAQGFQRAMAAAQTPKAQPQFVELAHDPLVQIALWPVEVASEPRLAGIVRHMPAARRLPTDHVATALGVSRSEARLAMLLCDGFSLSDAARELGWTLETARSCSKQIFARMGASGQADVIRRMLTSVFWLTPAGQTRIPAQPEITRG